jgi:hypothetical protein
MVSPTVDDGGPAFPVITPDTEGYANVPISGGMTLRDYFAGQALNSLTVTALANEKSDRGVWSPESMTLVSWEDRVAEVSYKLADAMLSRRQR